MIMKKLLLLGLVGYVIWNQKKQSQPQEKMFLVNGQPVPESMLPSLGYVKNAAGQWVLANPTTANTPVQNLIEQGSNIWSAAGNLYSVLLNSTKVLKKGDAGEEVRLLQKRLNEIKATSKKPGAMMYANLLEDGNFGVATENLLVFFTGKNTIAAKDVPRITDAGIAALPPNNIRYA